MQTTLHNSCRFSESPVKNVTSKRQSEAQQVYMEACKFIAVRVDIPLIYAVRSTCF